MLIIVAVELCARLPSMLTLKGCYQSVIRLEARQWRGLTASFPVGSSFRASQFYGATRALVETLTRFKFMEQNRGNVTLRSKSIVTGYTFNESKSAVTGELVMVFSGVLGQVLAGIGQQCRHEMSDHHVFETS